ncbi:8-amino-7-oxononanoate synthase [Gordonia sp. DT30]|uniref:8-amino-7-oxononanoate synthase n=1 Tax=Gordonia sp. DT30 TaxID=3416546 RepID=UPI003CF535FD
MTALHPAPASMPRTPGEHAAGTALAWLSDDQRATVEAGLHREPFVRAAGAELVNLASNDYLGLSTNPAVLAGAHDAVAQWGAGATASRLVAGTTRAHVDFESEIAAFLGFPAALLFSSGYLANVGAITALAGRSDLIVSDTGTHASLIDGCRLSRARVVVVERGDHRAVRAALADRAERRALVVTDSIYSVDGAAAPVRELYDAARAHAAALLVDEAHALGVRGPGGRGVVADAGLSGAPDLVVTAVASKSLGAQGGIVLGPTVLRDHLIDRARTFIFDTGLNPAAVGAARAALGVLRADPQIPERLRYNVLRMAHRLGVDLPTGPDGSPETSAVLSVILGDPQRAVAAAAACRARGVLVGCFRPPSVPAGTSRLRLTMRADLDAATVDRAADVVGAALGEVGAR